MQSGYLKLGRAPSDAERTHTGLAIQGTETQVHGVAKITHSYLRLEWCLPRKSLVGLPKLVCCGPT